MSLFLTSLNSGSNGNCYYIGNENEAVLIDAGLSCRETERRMQRLGLSMQKVKAIFISHEHSDHICGVGAVARKYQLPVYITPRTRQNSRLRHEQFDALPFKSHQPVQIGSLSVTGFPKYHDAADPHSFFISYQDIKVGVFTDIGAPCDHLIEHFSQCHAAILEANYCDDLLERGHYPQFLKNRIRSNHGHLSNEQALDLFLAYKPDFMSHILLGHLSRDNNDPELVRELFTTHADNTEVIIASRFHESEVYRITVSSEVVA